MVNKLYIITIRHVNYITILTIVIISQQNNAIIKLYVLVICNIKIISVQKMAKMSSLYSYQKLYIFMIKCPLNILKFQHTYLYSPIMQYSNCWRFIFCKEQLVMCSSRVRRDKQICPGNLIYDQKKGTPRPNF